MESDRNSYEKKKLGALVDHALNMDKQCDRDSIVETKCPKQDKC